MACFQNPFERVFVCLWNLERNDRYLLKSTSRFFFFAALGLDIVTPESLFGYESDGIPLDSILDYPSRSQEKVILPDTSSILESSLQVQCMDAFSYTV